MWELPVGIFAGILFVGSSGMLFNERFRSNKWLVLIAGCIALISTYLLTVQLVDLVLSRKIDQILNANSKERSNLDGAKLNSARTKSATNLIIDEKLLRGAAAYDSQNYQTAYEILLPLAHAGNSYAQTYIANMCITGRGTTRDDDAAFSWFQSAAYGGISDAQTFMGSFYRRGMIVAQDYVKAREWYYRAGHQNYASAQYWLAQIYFYGWGTQKNWPEAYAWATLAAEQKAPEIMAFQHQLESTLSASEIQLGKQRAIVLKKNLVAGNDIYQVTHRHL
jgi:hypothetical protein